MTSNDGAGRTRPAPCCATCRRLAALTRATSRSAPTCAPACYSRPSGKHDSTRVPVLPPVSPSHATRPARRLRTRVACAAAAALLALSGVAGYLRLNGPTPAAAQTMRIVHTPGRACA